MTEATTPTKAYVLANVCNSIELTIAEQLKSNQFLNLLTTCNISAKVDFNLPEEVILDEFKLIFIDFASFINVKKN